MRPSPDPRSPHVGGRARPAAGRLLAVALGVTTLAAAGCSDTTGPSSHGPGDGSTLALAVTAGGSPPSGAAVARDLTVEDGGDALVISRVAVVLREIELERQFDDCPDDSGRDSADDDADDDACEKFEVGPVLLDLALDGSIEQVVSVDVEPGVYDELEFEIHKPDDDDPEGRAFIREHPDFEDVSIRVEGSWNGQGFVFLQDLNEDQELGLSPPLEITGSTETRSLTLRLDVASWFRTGGGDLVDPRTANDGGPNEDLVEENIERSIEAFEDDDGDGRDDHDEDDGDDSDDD